MVFLSLSSLTGMCPASPALEGGVKGHNIKGNDLTGKPRPLGRGASLILLCSVLSLNPCQVCTDLHIGEG